MSRRTVAEPGVVRGRASFPTALSLAAAVWLMFPLVRLWPDIRWTRLVPDVHPPLVLPVLQLASAYAVTVLVIWGIYNRHRFVHRVAYLWQAASGGFGAYNLWINDYGWDSVTSFSDIPFFHGALPIATALLSFLLLSLPSSIAWVSGADPDLT